jgi:hypothetical protein
LTTANPLTRHPGPVPQGSTRRPAAWRCRLRRFQTWTVAMTQMRRPKTAEIALAVSIRWRGRVKARSRMVGCGIPPSAPRVLPCWGAYRARLAVNSRRRPDTAGHNNGRPTTIPVLVSDRFCCVAGQGFEPWKASADGFTVPDQLTPPGLLTRHNTLTCRSQPRSLTRH